MPNNRTMRYGAAFVGETIRDLTNPSFPSGMKEIEKRAAAPDRLLLTS